MTTPKTEILWALKSKGGNLRDYSILGIKIFRFYGRIKT